jgi:two-component system sensor histidine kinase RegB
MVLQIKDYGPGISPDVAEQLGETFISTKEEGMGIGLFLTHATINRFNGTVKLYSPKEGGTITQVTLPLLSVDEAMD